MFNDDQGWRRTALRPSLSLLPSLPSLSTSLSLLVHHPTMCVRPSIVAQCGVRVEEGTYLGLQLGLRRERQVG